MMITKKITVWAVFVIAITNSVFAISPDQYKAFILRWEGSRNVPYRDTNGWTVGIGHSLTANKEPVKMLYSQREIDTFFNKDLDKCLVIARKYIGSFDRKPENIKLVTISLIFNVGEDGFSKFKKYIAHINAGRYISASKELDNSRWADQVSRRAQHHIALVKDANYHNE